MDRPGVIRLADLARELEPVLRDAARDAHVPAACLAFRRADEVAELAVGTLNIEARIEATTDSLFQIGSITKLFTATLVMQLVEEGQVELDAPVRHYVPEFALADAAAASRVTVRHLLCHTGGFDGDVFDDFGRGEDSMHRYVVALADKLQLFAPGQMFSYCNAGYVVLGRLVELLRKRPWTDALREHVLDPLGARHVATVPEEALLFRTALGYMNSDDPRAPRPPRQWAIGWSMQAAGSMLSFSARELLNFAAMYLAHGRSAGRQVVDSSTVASMWRPEVTIPGPGGPSASGLGFALSWWPTADGTARLVVGHDGATLGGQAACLRMVPHAGVSVALLMNGGQPSELIDVVVRRVLSELAGVEMPPAPIAPDTPVALDTHRFVGRYEAASIRIDIEAGTDNELRSVTSMKGAIANEVGAHEVTARLRGYDATTLITVEPDEGRAGVLAFPETDEHGRASYLYAGVVLPRVPD